MALVQERLVCACKPCTQPSSQTLQSHEWRHSAYSPCKSAPQRSCGSGYKASSVARQARSLLPFNLLKVEPASHAVNTATSNLWQQFICMQKPAVEEVQLIKYKVSTGHQEFLISLSFCDGRGLVQEWYFCISIKKHLASYCPVRKLHGMVDKWKYWTPAEPNIWSTVLLMLKSIVGKSALFWQLLRPWSGYFVCYVFFNALK